MPDFILPGGNDRTVVMGATGSGKTTFGAWLLSTQRFDERPWVIVQFKDEPLWDLVRTPPLQILKLGQLPGKRGLYLMVVNPGQEEELDDWFWEVWRRRNVGIFCDEVTLIKGNGFKALLRQGRSLCIPIIACTQRPVDVDREVFTESQYKVVFGLDDARDYKTVKLFTRDSPVERPLPPRWSYWYDSRQKMLLTLKPVPAPDIIARTLRDAAPRQWTLDRIFA